MTFSLYFLDIMTCFMYLSTLWCTYWRHDILVDVMTKLLRTLGYTFRRDDILLLLVGRTYFWMAWRALMVMTYFPWCTFNCMAYHSSLYAMLFDIIMCFLFNVMTYLLTLWHTCLRYGIYFDIITYFLMLKRTNWHHEVVFNVMTYFLTLTSVLTVWHTFHILTLWTFLHHSILWALWHTFWLWALWHTYLFDVIVNVLTSWRTFSFYDIHSILQCTLGGRRSPAVACWASDHWVASSNPLRGKFWY